MMTAPWFTEVAGQEAVTPVTVFAASEMVKLPLLVVSCVEDAVMTALPLDGRVAGAV